MSAPPTIAAASRAWYQDTLDGFRATPTEEILGRLAQNGTFALLETQRDAWVVEIEFLRAALAGLDGFLLFEFSIPRMGRRIDAVLLAGPVVFAVEFKIGASSFDASAVDQVWDYALDLKNFREASHGVAIAPILVATAASAGAVHPQLDPDGVFRPLLANGETFRGAIEAVLARTSGAPIDAQRWLAAPYRPTPTIIEAARALYSQHSVDAIARSDAGAQNLRVTSGHIEEIVAEARAGKRKVFAKTCSWG